MPRIYGYRYNVDKIQTDNILQTPRVLDPTTVLLGVSKYISSAHCLTSTYSGNANLHMRIKIQFPVSSLLFHFYLEG
jgi:hypothetical protein